MTVAFAGDVFCRLFCAGDDDRRQPSPFAG